MYIYIFMTGYMGISTKKMSSMGFLLAVLIISLTLGSLTILINDNDATLPNIGMEGMSKSEKNTMDKNMTDLIRNSKNAPMHSTQ
jgi:hypothetical protein